MLLLERTAELDAIDELMGDAHAGRGRALLVRGPAGIGKTALLDAAVTRAGSLTVLRATGGLVERGVAFGVVRQLLERALRDASTQTRRRWTADAARPAGRLLLGDEAGATGLGADASMLHALFWLVVSVADDTPLLLVVDDLQLADDASLNWLLFLARRLDGLPVAVLGAMREGPSESRPPALGALAADQAVEVVSPGPLSPAAAETVVVRRLGPTPAGFCVAAHESTAGNPFLLLELLRAVERSGVAPDGTGVPVVRQLASSDLGRRILERMTALSSAVTRFASAVAVLGHESSASLAAELAGLSPDEGADAAAELVAAEILADSLPLRFLHPLVEFAVYDAIGAARRSAHHHRAARLLDAAGADVGVVATHLLRSEPQRDPWAAAVLARAASRALGDGGPSEAVKLAERGLAEPAPEELRTGLLRVLGMSLQRLGDPRAGRVFVEAIEAAPDVEQRVAIGAEAAFALMMAGEAAAASELLERLIAELDDPAGDAAVALRVQALGVSLATGSPFGDGIRMRLGAEVDRLPELGATGRYGLALLALDRALRGGTAAEARSLALAAIGDEDDYRESLRSGRPLNNALFALALTDEPELAFTRWEMASRAVRERGSVFAHADVLAWRALAHLLVGDLRGARADAQAMLDASTSALLLARVQRPIAVGVLVGVYRLTGDYAAAQELVGEHRPDRSQPDTFSTWFLICELAALRLAEHKPQEALELLDGVQAFMRRGGIDNTRFFPWRSYAGMAHLALGDRGAADRLFAEELRSANQFGAPSALGIARRHVALAADEETRIALLEQAAEELAASPALVDRAQALLDLGAALRRVGQRRKARDPLAEALDIAHRCGADALVDAASVELRAAGARPRSIVRSGVESLTPSEHRIARLAADGLTNRQIAQALFVTPKTVESHLYTAFRKLDVAARNELAAALTEAE